MKGRRKMKSFKLFFSNPILFFKKVFGRIKRAFKLYIVKDEFLVEAAKWFKDKGDETLRLNYPALNKSSIVFDLGGYVGDFAQQINDKYGCKVYLFEPHPKFYETCVERFSNNENIIPFNYGLSDTEGEFFLSDSVDGSSFLNPDHRGKGGLNCQLREILSVVDDLDIKKIDLMKINIEGGEYPLLLHIAKENRLDLVKEYQIQFHNFIQDAVPMRDSIVESLSKTHKRTWCYTFVWENWEKI